ncbi:MAG TPA: hypothetical protein DCM40_04330 [Maribacter sp.]|nr:hypothetical protein [Maribacter sp.]|tara:strand:+ start:87 stop:353 length:267 start_codon:yes stop_codon:yes gene_type:complete
MADKVKAKTSTKKIKPKKSHEEQVKQFKDSVITNVNELMDYLPEFSFEQVKLVGRAYGADVDAYTDQNELILHVTEVMNEFKEVDVDL